MQVDMRKLATCKRPFKRSFEYRGTEIAKKCLKNERKTIQTASENLSLNLSKTE